MPKRGFFLMYRGANLWDPVVVEAETEAECALLLELPLCDEVNCAAHQPEMRHSHIRAEWFPRAVEFYPADDPKRAGLSFRRFPIFQGTAHIVEHFASPRRRKGVVVYYRRGTILDETDAA